VSLLRQIRLSVYYLGIPALGAVTPLVVYPALTARYGAHGLAAIGIAQSLGSAAAVFAELGWGVLGPQRVARADVQGRQVLYESAFATKLPATLLMAPLAALAAYRIAGQYQIASAIMAFAFTLVALSPSWYLIGCNRPLAILYVETIPRIVFSIASAIAILRGAPLALYGVGIIATTLLTLVLTATVTGQRLWPRGEAFHSGVSVVKAQLPITLGRIISVIYTSLPITIVGIVSPGSTATFTAVERLMRMASSMLGSVPSRLQSWVGVKNGWERLQRSRRSLLLNVLLGLFSSLGFALVAPLVAPFIFSGAVTITFETSTLSASVLLVICASSGFGLSLVAEGRANWIGVANLGAAVVGVAAIVVLGGLWGLHGAILGELAAEIVGLMVQATVLFLGYRFFELRKKSLT
jgi:O-antigen/teichoic acid export membrane protein